MVDRRRRLVAACIPRERLTVGELFADVIADRRDHPPLFISVVQAQGAPEILYLGQFRKRRAAEIAAGQFISCYRKQHRATLKPAA